MTVTAWILVSWFLGLCGVVNVALQPAQAFNSAGHSKRFWLWVEVAGVVLSFTGILTWAVYTIGIRPGVVRAGGRRATRSTYWDRSSGPAGGAGSSAWGSGSTTNKPCGACGGSGKQSCFACSGSGRVSSSAYAGHAVASANNWCSSCRGSGKMTCSSCSGRGTVG